MEYSSKMIVLMSLLNAFVTFIEAKGPLPVKLTADMMTYGSGSQQIVIFRCTAGRNLGYHTSHVMTWSKITRDGKEKYLSINWDLAQHGYAAGYNVSSESPLVNRGQGAQFVFTLKKYGLTPADNGMYICRLHDFDRNMLGETSVPVVVFDTELALYPFKIEGTGGGDTAVNCMYNTSDAVNGSSVIISHVAEDGKSRRFTVDGTLADVRLSSKLSLRTGMFDGEVKHHVLTIKNHTKADNGLIVCSLENNGTIIRSINSTISIDTPNIEITPHYYLQVPEDSIAHFQCTCDITDTQPCDINQVSWSFVSKTGQEQLIYKNGSMVTTSPLYDVINVNGSLNLTIRGMQLNVTDGDYVCSVHEKNSPKILASARCPISVHQISLGALSIMDDYPKLLRLMCILSGTKWNDHYLENHSLEWFRVVDGLPKLLASNGSLASGVDPKRFEMRFQRDQFFSILQIKNVTQADYGEYRCKLVSKKSINTSILKAEKLQMYGKGNSTTFSGSYGFQA